MKSFPCMSRSLSKLFERHAVSATHRVYRKNALNRLRDGTFNADDLLGFKIDLEYLHASLERVAADKSLLHRVQSMYTQVSSLHKSTVRDSLSTRMC